jgi:outer membrane lipoprotein
MIRHTTILLLVILSACATSPGFRLEQIDYNLTPKNALQVDEQARGHQVLWGGTILSSKNFTDHTRLEVLAYPVDKEGRIDTDAEPLGRFYALHSGYLETAEYSKDRWVSLTGNYMGLENGKVGNADYVFPVVNINQTYLWTADSLYNSSPNVHFGIGVLFH